VSYAAGNPAHSVSETLLHTGVTVACRPCKVNRLDLKLRIWTGRCTSSAQLGMPC
jgi:hypothetical protein